MAGRAHQRGGNAHAPKDEFTKTGKGSRYKTMRTDYIEPEVLELLLTALMPPNRLALQLSMATGLRIGDCLALRTDVLRRSARPTITEEKTGKKRRIYIPKELYEKLLAQAGRYYVFEGRSDPRKHRTRAAVHKDLKRVARLYRLNGEKIKANVAPHTARKVYAVGEYRKDFDLRRVQKLLNHKHESITMLYAMADQLRRKK